MTKPKKAPQILTRADLFRMCEECDRDRRALRGQAVLNRHVIKKTALLLRCAAEMLEKILARPEL